MGLDTVELVIAIENYFNISIANRDAEQITTVNSMVTIVADSLRITTTDSTLYTNVYSSFCNAVKAKDTLHPDTLIAQYLPIDATEKWQQIAFQMGLELPMPTLTRWYGNKIGDRLLSLLSSNAMAPSYNWQSITLKQFIIAVCANNYQKLLKPNTITNTFEIFVAIVGITVNIAGVDYFEISPEKWFTSDLGMD